MKTIYTHQLTSIQNHDQLIRWLQKIGYHFYTLLGFLNFCTLHKPDIKRLDLMPSSKKVNKLLNIRLYSTSCGITTDPHLITQVNNCWYKTTKDTSYLQKPKTIKENSIQKLLFYADH